jgi:hypothetical protein
MTDKLAELKRRVDEAISGVPYSSPDSKIEVYAEAARILSRLIEKMPPEDNERYGSYDDWNNGMARGHNSLREQIINIITEDA